jgi:DNA-binding MarR family transcriptional regulator
LLALWEEDDITVKELGKKLYLDSGTLTPLLKKLEGMGIISRLRDTKDERNVFVKLTDKGKIMKEAASEIPHKLFCSTGLSPEKAIELRENLRSLLIKISQP